MTEPCKLLWVDLETAGSSPHGDAIFEVGAILTTSDLVIIDEYESLVHSSINAVQLAQAPDVVRTMHEASGLAADIRAGKGESLNVVEYQVMKLITDSEDVHPTVLAGSGVGHFDKRFIGAQMPNLASLLAYYVIDVGVLRRSLDMWGLGHLLPQDQVKPHRALDDARLHLEEARTIRNALRSIGGVA